MEKQSLSTDDRKGPTTQEEVTEAKPSPAPKLLDENFRAESWFDEYPGYIQYQPEMTFKMHQEYTAMVVDTQGTDESLPVIIKDGSGRSYVFSMRNIKAALLFAETVSLKRKKAPKGKTKKLNFDKPEELPVEVAAFLGLTAAAYLTRQTMFSRVFGSSLEIPE